MIVRPSALGDVCRTVPALASLRQAYPDARIDWVVQDSFTPAVAAHPAVSNVISFPRRRFSDCWKRPQSLRHVLQWLAAIRRTGYDLVYDLQGLGRSGLITRATGARRRVGDRDARELAWLGYNVRHRPALAADQPLHTVDRMLALLEMDGVPLVHDMRLYADNHSIAWWETMCESKGLSAGNYAVLAPTSRWRSKRWPIERWAELVSPLLLRGFDHVVLIGGPNELSQVSPIVPTGDTANSPLLSLVDQTTLGQTMAIIANAGLVVANDSAPLHMAVGFHRPCVGLFGPTDPAVVGPYRQPHASLRAFQPRPGERIDYKDAKLADRLMRVISTAAVVQQIDRVLSHHRGQSSHQNDAPAAQPAQPCSGGRG